MEMASELERKVEELNEGETLLSGNERRIFTRIYTYYTFTPELITARSIFVCVPVTELRTLLSLFHLILATVL